MLLKLEEDGVVIGWANAEGQDAIDLKAQGYVESSEEERQRIIAKKHKPVAESVTIAPQQEVVKGKPGRKPKTFLASLGNGDNTDSN